MESASERATRKGPAVTPDTLELTDALPVAEHGLIGRQAMEIIGGLLAADSQCDETIRQALRHQLAASPGRPDLALLEHVLALRGETGPTMNLQRQSVSAPKCDP